MRRLILVADDSSTIQKVIKIAFARYEVELAEAGSYVEALATVSQRRPDALMIDASLPGSRGPDDFAKLRQEAGNAPVLLLLGSYEAVDERALQRAGFVHLLKKPFESADLIAKAEALLGESLAAVNASAPGGASTASPGTQAPSATAGGAYVSLSAAPLGGSGTQPAATWSGPGGAPGAPLGGSGTQPAATWSGPGGALGVSGTRPGATWPGPGGASARPPVLPPPVGIGAESVYDEPSGQIPNLRQPPPAPMAAAPATPAPPVPPAEAGWRETTVAPKPPASATGYSPGPRSLAPQSLAGDRSRHATVVHPGGLPGLSDLPPPFASPPPPLNPPPPPLTDQAQRGRRAFASDAPPPPALGGSRDYSEAFDEPVLSAPSGRGRGRLDEALAAELPPLVRLAVEDYCERHFKSLAREIIAAELRRLADEKARHLVDN